MALCLSAGPGLTADGSDGYIYKGGKYIGEIDTDDVGDLARAAQNPIADLISVPFQNNTNFNFGPREKTQNVLNIQPVGGGFGRVFLMGGRPVNMSLQGFYDLEKPENVGPEWSLRGVAQFMFPIRKT